MTSSSEAKLEILAYPEALARANMRNLTRTGDSA